VERLEPSLSGSHPDRREVGGYLPLLRYLLLEEVRKEYVLTRSLPRDKKRMAGSYGNTVSHSTRNLLCDASFQLIEKKVAA
jgi:hypothetical protein